MRRGPLFNAAARRRVSAAPRSASAVPPPDPDPDPDPEPGGGSLATTVAVDNRVVGTSGDYTLNNNEQTDLIVEFGLPIKAGDMLAGDRIVVHDNGVRLYTEEGIRSTDLNGDLRFVGLAVKVPTLAANAVGHQLVITVEEGVPTPGPTLTVAQLLALDTDAQCTVTVIFGGVTYTADFRTAAAGSTTWTKGQPHRRAGWYHDGLMRKTFTCLMPLMDGVTPHPHLYVEFMATAYSTDEFDEEIYWDFNPLILNGWVTENGPDNRAMDVTITTGIADPVTTHAYNDRTFDITLTKTSGGVNSGVPGTFTNDDHGCVIEEIATGKKSVISSVASGGASVSLRTSPAGNTLPTTATWTAGQAAVRGLLIRKFGHCWFPGAWHGASPKYLVRHERDYIVRSRAVLNWAIPSSYVNNSNGKLGNGNGTVGTTFLQSLGSNPARFKGVKAGEEDTGTGPEARVIPECQYIALRKMDADVGPYVIYNAYRRIFENGYIQNNHLGWMVMDDATGAPFSPVSRPNLVNNSLKSGPAPLLEYTVNETAHDHDYSYLPFVLTGKIGWLRGILVQTMKAYIVGKGSDSNGIDPGRNYFEAVQSRCVPWSDRTIGHLSFCLPDGMPRSVLGWQQSDPRDWQRNAAHRCYVQTIDDGTGRSGISNLTVPGPGPDMNSSPAIYWVLTRGSDSDDIQNKLTGLRWHQDYWNMVGPHLDELGLLTFEHKELYRRTQETWTDKLTPDNYAPGSDMRLTFGKYDGSGPGNFDGVFEGWPRFYDECVAKNQNYQAPYGAYHWMGLVLADDKGWVEYPERTRAALDLAMSYMGIARVGDPLEGVPSTANTSNNQVYLRHWVKKRTD